MKKLRFSLLSLAVAAALLLPALPARAEGPGAHRPLRRADGGLHRPGAL